MTEAETVLLLGALSKFPRQIMAAPDDIAVAVWREAIAEDMPVDWAIRWVARYFAEPDRAPIGPGELNAAWRSQYRAPSVQAGPGTEPPAWWREARAAGKLPEVSE